MKIQTAQKATLRITGLVGTVIFVTFFSLTFTLPGWVEKFGADFIERKATQKLDNVVDGLQPPKGEGALSKLAESIFESNQERIEGLRSRLKAKVHEKRAAALAEIRNLDCECREKWANYFREGYEFEFDILQTANDKITDFVQSTYMEVLAKLKRDIRIFTGTNAAVFLFLLMVSFVKPRAIAHLFLPGVLLVVSTIICSYFYIFQQNWLLTIIYSDYLGFLYLGYLGVVFSLLCDIVFNQGQITTGFVNAFFEAIGSSLTLVPC